jgi:hypothetical protein
MTPGLSFGQSIQLPSVGGMVVAADGKTLVIAVPTTGKLVFVDSVAGREIKSVDVGFQPAALARQGKTLFAATTGAPTIHAIDIETGKKVKEFELGGEAVDKIACHPTKGYLYATNANYEVHAIDPATGKSTKTRANGRYVAVDPTDENLVYTNLHHSGKDIVIVQELPGRKAFRVELIKGRSQLVLMKYAAKGTDLACLAVNDNAATGGTGFGISQDGKLVAVAGQYKAPKQKGITHNVAGFSTSDMTGMKGQYQMSYFPRAIAFHAQLDMVAIVQEGVKPEISVFNSASFVKVDSFKLPRDALGTYQLIFAGEGTKVVCATTSRKAGVNVEFHPLSITDDQRAELKKRFGN